MTTPFLPSPLFFIQQPLQQVIFNKDDGTLLAAGVVSYFSDPGFTIPKDVYQVTNAPDGTYFFTDIGSVLTLSSIGSFVDIDGNNFTPMLFPWTGTVLAPGQFEPYYITVYSSGGILQFTVTGYPFNNFSIAALTEEGGDTVNQITNPQFVESLLPTAGNTFTITGAMTIPVAPGWFIDAVGSSGTIFVQQAPLSIDTPANAPYALQIITSGSASGTLRQRIYQSPRLLDGDVVSGLVEISSINSFSLTMTYKPSSGLSTDIFTEPVVGGSSYQTLSATKEITTVPNPDFPNTPGYIDITFNIPTLSSFFITSVQLVGVTDINTTVPDFVQISTPLQKSALFYYWQDPLNYKPIPSYLVGWDFPLNPAQPNGDSGNFSAAPAIANGSAYAWDQTILFATVASQLSYSRDSTTGGLKIATGGATTFAVVQYLPAQQAKELLSQHNTVSLQGFFADGAVTPATTISGTVTLAWTGGTLPSLLTPTFQSVVAALPTTAIPTLSVASTWNVVPNIPLGNNPAFTLNGASTKAPIYLSGWDATVNSTPATTATYFAIIVSFTTLQSTQTVTLDFCGLFGGDIATRPAPQANDEVLRECQYYYESSYNVGIVPGAITNNGQRVAAQTFISGTGSTSIYSSAFELPYNSLKISLTPSFTAYNPGTGTSGSVISRLYYGGSSTASANSTFATFWTTLSASQKSIQFVPSSGTALITNAASGNSVSGFIQYQYTVDARLGLVA